MAGNYHKTGTILYTIAFLVLFCSTSFAQDKILAKWTFDEGSGDTVHDISGNGHHGLIKDAPAWVEGVSGSALRFDGDNDYVVVNHDGTLAGMEKLSVEVWIQLGAEVTGDNKNILNVWGPGSWDDDAYGIGFVNNNPRWAASVSGITGGVQDLNNMSNSPLNVGYWYHLVMVFTSDSLKLYTNGEQSFSGTTIGEPIKAITRELMIAYLDYDTNSNFEGKIDEITLYNYALPPDTIKEHFITLNPYNPSVIGHWTFDEGNGDTAYDISGNGNHCVIIDGSWVPGISGSALGLDGVDDYAVIGHGGSLTGMENLTIEVWAKLKAEVTGENKTILNIWGPADFHRECAYGIGFVNSDPHWAASLCGLQSGVTDLNNMSDDSLGLNSWYHLAIVFSLDSLKLYTNGKLAFSDASFGMPIKSTNRILMLGALDKLVDPTNTHFNGDIDEITIYDEALSTDTIAAHYSILHREVIAYWNFNEGEGDSAYDFSGNGNHLKLYNGAKWVKTHNGFGVDLDGFNDVCKAADSPNQNGLTALTAEAVFLIKQYNIYDQFTVIVDKWGPGSSSDDAWACYLYNEGVNGLYGNVVGGVNNIHTLYSYDKLPLNRWIHLTMVWDNNNLTFYVNGQKNAETAETTIDVIQNSNSEIRIGNGADENNGLFGIIDHVVLYNYALSPDSIFAHYEDLIKPVYEINLGIKNHYVKPGEEIWVPVYITNFEDGVLINSIQFSLTFDASVASFQTVLKDSGIVKDWSFAHNPNNKDSIIFSMGGVGQTIGYGEGELLRCKFEVSSQQLNVSTDLLIVDALIDEGNNVKPTTTAGKIIVIDSVNDTTVIYGDLSGNKEVTAYDGAAVIQYVVGSLTLPDPNFPNFTTEVADVSGNGTITSYDAALVFKYSVGLIYKFPCETGLKEKVYRFNNTYEEFPDAALRLVKSPLSTANTVYYDIFGSGIETGISCDISLKYDPAKLSIEQGGSITTEQYYNLESSLDNAKLQVKISITTVDEFSQPRNIKLATIEAPAPDTGALKDALLFVKALVNEQEIKDLDPMVSIGIVPSNGYLAKNNIMMNSSALHINNSDHAPVTVSIYDLLGKRVYQEGYSASCSRIRVDFNGIAQGLYVYKIKIGAKTITKTFLISK